MQYVGQELELFAEASNWKDYWASVIRPYVQGHVLEVGAGLGATTQVLCTGREDRWVCLEPDIELGQQVEDKIANGDLPPVCRLHRGVISDLPVDLAFDSILYIDVLEHIENDAGEIAEAARRLSLGGYLVVLSPAHNSLFSPFDQAVGHYRRYSRRSLEVLGTRPLSLVKSVYLDSVGILLSFVNRWVLRRSIPTKRNVMTWDRRVIPVSRTLDRYFRFAVGKTVVCVWRRATNA